MCLQCPNGYFVLNLLCSKFVLLMEGAICVYYYIAQSNSITAMVSFYLYLRTGHLLFQFITDQNIALISTVSDRQALYGRQNNNFNLPKTSNNNEPCLIISLSNPKSDGENGNECRALHVGNAVLKSSRLLSRLC